ncbi:MAG: hypothetical protein QM731_26100 [Chitinophagaceae bacterium]
MKKLCSFILCVAISTMGFAQKPSKEQMDADKKRLAEAMQKLNEKTSKMDPNAKKGYDSLLNVYGMGEKMNSAINQVNNNTTLKSGNASVGLIPAKDTKAIATIGATPTNASIGACIGTTSNATFAAVLPAAKNKAGEIYTALKQKGASPDEIGSAAAALWIQGRSQIALSMMASVCKDNPANTDNLSNYAAMLSMMGAPELAIPILNNLNTRFKNNTTILNNLGQAWFALGEVDKASKYLDSTLALSAAHPQANETKCLIDESKGNKTAAAAHARSAFKQGTTPARKDQLQRLGLVPGDGDYSNFPSSSGKSDDLLNLGAFVPLEFPKSYEAQVSYEQQWKQFRAEIDQQLKPLQKITEESNKEMTKQLEAQKQQFMNAMNKTLANPGSVSQASAMQIVNVPMFSEKMNSKEKLVLQNLQRKKDAIIQKISAFKKGEGAALRAKYDDAVKGINKKWAGVGEGGTENNESICNESVAAVDAYLNAYNTKLEEFYAEYLIAQKQYLNELSYLSLYTTYPQLLPGINAGLKMQWLNDLAYKAEVLGGRYGCAGSKSVKGGRLTAFKDPRCNINSEFGQSLGLSNLGFKIKIDCSGMSTEFNALLFGITLNQDLDHTGFGDSFKSCTVSIVPKPGVTVKMGPVEASAKVGAGLDIAIDRTGITDVTVVGSVEAEANILDLRETSNPKTAEGSPVGASAGVEGRISLSSGAGSINGTGIFNKK